MHYAIGIDIGGTNVKIAAVTDAAEVLWQNRVETDDLAASWKTRVPEAVAAIEKQRGAGARWIGVTSPGLAARNERTIAWMRGRMAAVQGFDWTDHLKHDRLVPVLNDAHAALLGEVWCGGAVGCRNVVMFTLGTGVGGAILCDGRLLKGQLGRAGHLGHLSLNADEKKDIVNTPGSLEDMIGECTLQTRGGGRYNSTKELVGAHLRGDATASAIWLKSVKQLAAGIVSTINAVDPEMVILGGGIAQAGPALWEPLEKYMDEFEWRPTDQRVRIVPAKLGDWAGALGAAWNAIRRPAE